MSFEVPQEYPPAVFSRKYGRYLAPKGVLLSPQRALQDKALDKDAGKALRKAFKLTLRKLSKLRQNCAVCGRVSEGLEWCSGCQMVQYCSTSCRDRRADTHSRVCHQLRREAIDQVVECLPGALSMGREVLRGPGGVVRDWGDWLTRHTALGGHIATAVPVVSRWWAFTPRAHPGDAELTHSLERLVTNTFSTVLTIAHAPLWLRRPGLLQAAQSEDLPTGVCADLEQNHHETRKICPSHGSKENKDSHNRSNNHVKEGMKPLLQDLKDGEESAIHANSECKQKRLGNGKSLSCDCKPSGDPTIGENVKCKQNNRKDKKQRSLQDDCEVDTASEDTDSCGVAAQNAAAAADDDDDAAADAAADAVVDVDKPPIKIFSSERPVRIHLIGADKPEVVAVESGLAQLIHRVLQTPVDLTLVAPDLLQHPRALAWTPDHPLQVCPGVRAVTYAGLYHDYWREHVLPSRGETTMAAAAVDAAIAIHPGCHTAEQLQLWWPTLQLLARHGVSLLITTYNLAEYNQTRKVLQELSPHVSYGGLNPLRSLQSKQTPYEPDHVWAYNSYVLALTWGR